MCLHCLQVIARKNVAPSVQQGFEPTGQYALPNETADKSENKGVRIYGYCARFCLNGKYVFIDTKYIAKLLVNLLPYQMVSIIMQMRSDF